MATISVTASATLIGSSNRFVLALYDNANPASPVFLESQSPNPPYPAPFSVTFAYNAIIGHAYIVELWESATTSPSGTLRNSTTITPAANTTNVRLNDELIVGTTTGLTDGNTVYTNASYIGWNIWFERVGSGTMRQVTTPQYTYDITTGKITLTDGTNFNNGETYITHFYPQIANAVQPVISDFLFGTIITASVTLTNANKNESLQIQSATNNIAIALPALSSISDFDGIYLASIGGNHINAVINTNGTDKIQFSTQVTQLIIGQCEILELFKMTLSGVSLWYIKGQVPPSINMRGELVHAYISNQTNCVPAVGSLVLRATFPGLWAFVSANGLAVTESSWANTDTNGNFINKAKYSSGDGIASFRLPDLTNYHGMHAASSSPGNFTDQQVGQHAHPINTLNYGDAGVVGILGPGSPNNGVSGGATAGGGAYKVDATDPNVGGTLNLIKSTSFIPLIRC